jgi:myosin heavy subunit
VSNTYPHVFITASIAYQQLIVNTKNQSVLISGESGAGKTETTKKVLNYLANVAPATKSKKADSHSHKEEPGIEDKILQSNPLLEALGNAKTLRNNNSSRFGKWMKVYFDHTFHIDGCEIVNYLLEKSRLVTQNTNERNYHMFYMLLSGANAALREACGLQTADQYRYLDQSGCYTIEGVDDDAEFQEVLAAMHTLQFSADLQDSILKLLAAILHIGNITFEAGATEGSSAVTAGCAGHVEFALTLLGLDRAAFMFALTEKTVQMGRGSVVGIKLTASQALDSKDTLAKALYSNLFDWIIR